MAYITAYDTNDQETNGIISFEESEKGSICKNNRNHKFIKMIDNNKYYKYLITSIKCATR